MISLFTNGDRYHKSFQQFLQRSDEYDSMQNFIDNLLPDILESSVKDMSELNIIGVGSGSGELDLNIISAFHRKYPEVTVENEVVEPILQQLDQYRDLVARAPGLDHIKFHWYEMTAESFEAHWKENKRTKKVDVILMFQMLYYEDFSATIDFFKSLLDTNGKLVISLLAENSGWAKLDKAYGVQLTDSFNITADNIKQYLDSKGLRYQTYLLPSQIDVTACFIEGDEEGEMMLDFLTEVLHFSQSSSPELKAGIMEFIRHPDCSVESNGKVMFNNDNEIIVVINSI
ncbi:histamine N-methyltransferase-like [Brachionichthys hirsutus]|uniref:histamine N-methyltransferase-like n=1 Tax=Brachionichthys hirsutus TaxID=412623 RepID=UPI0036053A3D